MRKFDPKKFIPHREPILMLDELEEVVPGRKAVGLKCLARDCPLFQGHLPGNPILPGVFLIEGVAQAGAVMLLSGENPEGCAQEGSGRLVFVRNAKFRRPVLPEQTLSFEVALVEESLPFYTIEGKVHADGQCVAEASVVITLAER
ncbi:MAG: 3-hydroxyacyl-ACP dehydratase FabZ family protein [Planctomycetota bacterium]